MNTITCHTCGTELKRHQAVMRGNAIDNTPTAWCRVHAIAAGIFTPPMPVVVIPAPRVEAPARRRLLVFR